MNKAQIQILKRFFTVIVLTVIAVIVLINWRHLVNRSEAIRAMEHLSTVLQKYREQKGWLPPKSYVHNIEQNLTGHARLGQLHYRARWISYDAPPETILAYTKKDFHSIFLQDGFVVLRLDGKVRWLNEKEGEKTLSEQQKMQEIEALKDNP